MRLSEAEFIAIDSVLPPPSPRGRPWAHELREIWDAIFYVVRTGCQWRVLPHDFPPWPTVCWWFRRWRLDGTWELLNATLREQLRLRIGRQLQPSAAILDSQSVKTISAGGIRGYDGAEKLSARKRHVLVETQGWRKTPMGSWSVTALRRAADCRRPRQLTERTVGTLRRATRASSYLPHLGTRVAIHTRAAIWC